MKNTMIRAIGRLQEPWHKEAVHMYATRLERFGGIEIVELPEGHGKSAKPDPHKGMKTEGEALLKGISDDATIIALDSHGKTLDSQSFSEQVALWSQKGRVVFLIGGSWGIDTDVLKKADFVLSFGPMTFPHGIARLMLIEQIYRAKMIETGSEYHK
jgi:23S rRNA (pseudouridine1915-N3)-methyltransferase